MAFLAQFKRYMKMNRDANIVKDPFKRCNYFLSLMEGLDTKEWVQQLDNWLNAIKKDHSILPWLHNEWQVMESKLKKSFINYAKHKRANNE